MTEFFPQQTCPIPIQDYPKVTMAHGGGGRLMHQLIQKMFLTAFRNPVLEQSHDSAVISLAHNKRLAITTDSYVVNPLFFPNGNIGSLAVNGTINDLSMAGATPLYITLGLILEEGLPMEDLWKVIQTIAAVAEQAGVQIITGDTKVVDKGKGDGMYINTTGVGILEHDKFIHPSSIREGDKIIINGDIGRHGMAIMAKREGLEFESEIESDCCPLWGEVHSLLDNNIDVHCLRDATRGGVASTLNEIAQTAAIHIRIYQDDVPLRDDVHGACEILGFDPLYVACEGRFLAFVPSSQADKAVEILDTCSDSKNASVIGEVIEGEKGEVTIKSSIGSVRILDMLSGEQLPRIC